MQLLESLFQLVLRASFHGTLIVLVILSIQFMARKRLTAKWRHALWFALLIRLSLPDFPNSPVSPLNLADHLIPKTSVEITAPVLPESTLDRAQSTQRQPVPPERKPLQANPATTISNSRTTTVAPVATTLSMMAIASTIWFSVMALLLGRLASQQFRFTRQLKIEAKSPSPILQNTFAEAAKALQLDEQHFHLVTCNHVRTPCVCGVLRPTIILPTQAVRILSQAELSWVLRHELAHLKRRDTLQSWLEAILCCVHWFNPLLWLAMKRVRADRELATDELVTRHTNDANRRAYGETIINLLEAMQTRGSGLAGVVGIAEDKENIRQRLHALTLRRPSSRSSVMVFGICAVLIAVFLLEAQPKTKSTENSNDRTPRLRLQAHGSNTPIANAKIEVRFYHQDKDTSHLKPTDQVPLSYKTDEDGEVLLKGISGIDEMISIRTTHPDYIGANRSFGEPGRDSLPDLALLEMFHRSTIGGRVVDQEDQPIPNVAIYLSFSLPADNAYDHDYWIERPRDPVFTDENGHWSSDAIPDIASSVYISPTHSDYAMPPKEVSTSRPPFTQFERQREQVPLSRMTRTDHKLRLAPGGKIYGTVMDQSGKSVSGATVKLAKVGYPEVRTDASGKFLLPVAHLGDTHVTVEADGFAPFRKLVSIDPDTAHQVIELQIGKTLQFQFIDQNGVPIAGVQASLRSRGGYHPDTSMPDTIPKQPKTSNAQGEISFENVPNRELAGFFYREGYRPVENYAIRHHSDPSRIILRPARDLLFNVTDAEGKPIPEFTVIAGRVVPRGPVDPVYNWGPVLDKQGTKGRLKTTDAEIFRDWNLPDNGSVFRIEAAGFHSKISRRIEPREQAVTINVQLQPNRDLKRRLQLPSGVPLAHRTLFRLENNEFPHTYKITPDMTGFESYEYTTQIQTDERGEFMLPSISNEPRYIVGLFEEGFVFEPETRHPNLIVYPWSQVEGIWTEAGQPVAGCSFGMELAEHPWFRQPRVRFMAEYRTDSRGRYSLKKVPPAELDIYVRLPIDRPHNLPFVRTIEPIPGSSQTINVEIPQARTITGKLDLDPAVEDWLSSPRFSGTIIGRLRPDQAAPPIPENITGNPRATVKWLFSEWFPTPEGTAHRAKSRFFQRPFKIDTDGRFRAEMVRPGRYTASFLLSSPGEPSPNQAVSPDQAFHSLIELTVTESSPLEIDLGLIQLNSHAIGLPPGDSQR